MGTPWYGDGLRFRCTRCGNCCTGAPGYVWVGDDEIAALAELLGEPAEQVREFYARAVGGERSLREKANGDCVFFDREKGCTVYEARPRQCRTWPFWERNVETPESWRRTGAGCPGVDRGEFIPADEIARRIAVIRL